MWLPTRNRITLAQFKALADRVEQLEGAPSTPKGGAVVVDGLASPKPPQDRLGGAEVEPMNEGDL